MIITTDLMTVDAQMNDGLTNLSMSIIGALANVVGESRQWSIVTYYTVVGNSQYSHVRGEFFLRITS